MKNTVFNEDNMLAGRNSKIFDIQQKFGAPSIEIEGAVRYLMNFIGNNPQEIFICFAMKDAENLNKVTLDQVKDVLLTVPVFAE